MGETEIRVAKHRVVVERDPSLRWRPWRFSVEVMYTTTWSTWKTGRARSYAAACRRGRRNRFLCRVPGGSIREEFVSVIEYEAYVEVKRESLRALPSKYLGSEG